VPNEELSALALDFPALDFPALDFPGLDLPERDRDGLVERLVAAFRWQPHINNVLTHICASQWTRIAEALRAIFDPTIARADLSPLACNIVELMWAERGVTGRILKPYLREVLARSLSERDAARLLLRIAALDGASETERPGPSARVDGAAEAISMEAKTCGATQVS
jgi:hypothetical protein